MSEILKSKSAKYNYKYIQFSVSSSEKEQIKNLCKLENYRTLSDFIRRIIFDYMRRQLNPDLFLSNGRESLNTIKLEHIINSIKEILRNQEDMLQNEDSLAQLKEKIYNLHEIAEKHSLSKEREIIIQHLKKNDSLSLRQIQEETNFGDDIIFKVISDMNFFKITPMGRFSLR